MADKDKTAAESLLDFAKLPVAALDTYISFYDLAKAFPPPTLRSSSYGDDEYDNEDEEDRTKQCFYEKTSDEADEAYETVRDALEGPARKMMKSNGMHMPLAGMRPGPQTSPSLAVADGSFAGSGTVNGASGKRGNAPANLGDDEARQYQQQRLNSRTEEDGISCPSHFYDAEAATRYLGAAAGRHFDNLPPPKEGEVVVQFLYRCRAGDKVLKIFSG